MRVGGAGARRARDLAPAGAGPAARARRRPRPRRPRAGFLADIQGAAAFSAGRATAIAGLRVEGRDLVIRLDAPAGDFLQRLAMPFSCAVPARFPIGSGQSIVPSAGPYYVVRWVPTRTL